MQTYFLIIYLHSFQKPVNFQVDLYKKYFKYTFQEM